MKKFMYDDLKELCLVQGEKEKMDDPSIVEQVPYLKANESMIWRKEFEELNL